MQRLQGPLRVVHRVGAAEAAGEQQIGELGDQILEIQVVELVAREFRVAILHS